MVKKVRYRKIKNLSIRVEFTRGPAPEYSLPPKGGSKRVRGEPVLYDEVKQTMNTKLTPTVIHKLEDLAIQYQISRSEVIERVFRGIIKL